MLADTLAFDRPLIMLVMAVLMASTVCARSSSLHDSTVSAPPLRRISVRQRCGWWLCAGAACLPTRISLISRSGSEHIDDDVRLPGWHQCSVFVLAARYSDISDGADGLPFV